MSYFNYHAKAKNKIKNNELKSYEIVEKWNHISPALVLHFLDGTTMPIREHKFIEYFELIEKHFNKP